MAKYTLTQNGKIIEFNRIEMFDNLKNDDLKDIIKFTGFFKTPEELRLFLMNSKLIENNDLLKITYQQSKELKNLKYGIAYREDLKFLSERNIKIFIQNNKNNYAFLDALSNYLENPYSPIDNTKFLKRYMLLLQKNQAAIDDKSEIAEDMDYAIEDLVTNECHRYDSKTKQHSSKLNFRGMRDLGMFLSRYYKSNKNLIIDNLVENEYTEYVKTLDEKTINESVNKEKIKVKSKKKNEKKYNPDQMTLADFGII